RRTAGAAMNAPTNLWLIRHAPVDGPRGVIHGPDAPADLSDATAFAALKARLPANPLAVCSPARRTRETAERLGLVAVEQAAFREQDFGAWTGRRHNELAIELGAAVDVGQSPVGSSVEVQTGHHFEQTLVGTVRDRNGQRRFIEGLDVAADDTLQQPAHGALLGGAVAQIVEFLLKSAEGPQAV